MNTPILFFKQHALATFCTLTIVLTFAITFLPIPGQIIPMMMVFIPAIMAISLTALSEGKAGVRLLLGKLLQWRLDPKWVAIAIGLGLAVRLTMSFIALGLGMISTIHLRPGGPASFVFLTVVFLVFAIPEELGWRGYALPRLLERRSPLAAGLIVGVLWGSLHLALLLPGMMNAGASPVPTLLSLVGGSVLFTWLYINSGGSIVLTTLFHTAQSFFVIVNDGIPVEQQAWLMAGVYLAMALMIAMAGGVNFIRKPVAGKLQPIEVAHSTQPVERK